MPAFNSPQRRLYAEEAELGRAAKTIGRLTAHCGPSHLDQDAAVAIGIAGIGTVAQHFYLFDVGNADKAAVCRKREFIAAIGKVPLGRAGSGLSLPMQNTGLSHLKSDIRT